MLGVKQTVGGREELYRNAPFTEPRVNNRDATDDRTGFAPLSLTLSPLGRGKVPLTLGQSDFGRASWPSRARPSSSQVPLAV